MNKTDNVALALPASSDRTDRTVEAFKNSIVDNLYYTLGQGALTADARDVSVALALTVRDYLMERFRRTVSVYAQKRPKFVYYLSAEYLTGRQNIKNMLYTDTTDLARQAVAELGYDLDELIALEPEPALGNGGLGRLAACYCDSLATLDIPSVAYGINYEFGIFKQSIRDGYQVESPDDWLYFGTPWEFPQPDNRIEVKFGGHTEKRQGDSGKFYVSWIPAETVLGEPSHMLVPGYKTPTVNLLRLWRAKASKEFDFQIFDIGDYARAAEQKVHSENISKVLYPNDNTLQGRELRLKQEYFFVCCSLKDILRRFLRFDDDWAQLPEKAVIQLNDTHPVVAIPELMRLLMDEHGLDWETAWSITRRMFAYTCHTLMPEALERWPVGLFERLLPRHMEIIYEINKAFLDEVRQRFPEDPDMATRMSIIGSETEPMLRMAYLAGAACFSINGVAELHTNLLKQLVLRDFYRMWPEKFSNKTNGVSPRRFVKLANPRLADLITSKIGDAWLKDLEALRALEPYADDPEFQASWRAVKRQNKIDLAATVLELTGVVVGPDTMFDVMVKRLHEYKRQLLKVLHIISLYHRLKADPDLDIVPRTFIFGAKAAPGYHMAKLIIKLINSVAEVVNNDAEVSDQLKVAFLPNFNVTLGEKVYPAADLSEQISLAGFEASGTGNMKFALNGALTIGTLDGANIEIRQRVGEENFFLFGMTVDEVQELQRSGYRPVDYYHRDPELRQAIDSIASGYFSHGDAELFRPVVESLLHRDDYMLFADYPDFIARQDAVNKVYLDKETWTRMSILNTARCGYFSSDRSIRQYAQDIWKVSPLNLWESPK